VDLFQGLLQLTIHDLDKKALPAAKRGELMGQLLSAIVIMVLAKKVSPSLDLQGDKIGRAVLSAGQKLKVATKELPAVKRVDAAITGLKIRVTEHLGQQAEKLQQAFQKATHRLKENLNAKLTKRAEYLANGAGPTGKILARKAILKAFRNVVHTSTSREILEGIEAGKITVIFKRSLRSTQGGFAKGNRIYINANKSIEDILTYLVHEGRHQIDKAAGIIPIDNPGGVVSLFAELRAHKDAALFAEANGFKSAHGYKFHGKGLVELAINIEEEYQKQIGRRLTDDELFKAIDMLKAIP
jgi:hypothetical protein